MSDHRDVKFPADSHRISGEHALGYHQFDEGRTALPSKHRFAILACMDARIDPTKLAGLRGSDAHIIRNAGARATEDAIRSLVLSYKLLGTREWYIVQHTRCGMALLTEELTRELLQSGPRAHGANGANGAHAGSAPLKINVPSARDGGHVHKLALLDQEKSVAVDVARIRNHPIVPSDVAIFGYIYDVETGRFSEVAPAVPVSETGVRATREVASLPLAAAR